MNSNSNSDTGQCTESKLGQVHKVHTQGTKDTRTAPCRSAHWAVSWPHLALSQDMSCRVASRKPAGSPCACLPCHHPLQSQYKSYIATQTFATHRVTCAAACVVAFLRRVAGRCCAVSQPYCAVSQLVLMLFVRI